MLMEMRSRRFSNGMSLISVPPKNPYSDRKVLTPSTISKHHVPSDPPTLKLIRSDVAVAPRLPRSKTLHPPYCLRLSYEANVLAW